MYSLSHSSKARTGNKISNTNNMPNHTYMCVMWRYFFLIVKLIKFTNMSDLEKKARIFSNTEGNQSSKSMREVEYDTGRCVGYLAGFKDCQKEYEEKLRWIPVEEKLPEKMQTEPSESKVVQVKSKNFIEPFCAFYNHIHNVWLPYPFGSNSQIEGITEWRSFL